MAIDPITILMFALIALLIFFMFRNNKKRQAAQLELQNSMQPGAEVMLQSGIFGTVESFDDETNRATIRSGTSTLVVHRNAITQVVTPVVSDHSADTAGENGSLAPDDDPAFGERVANGNTAEDPSAGAAGHSPEGSSDASDDKPTATGTDEAGTPETPKA